MQDSARATMLDLNDFRIFVAIVQCGGFSAAARALQQPVSTLSYRLKELEKSLGLSLLMRSSRNVCTTEAGEEFYQHAVGMMESATQAEMAMRGRLNEPVGKVRFTTSVATAHFAMPALLNDFMTNYPRICLVQHTTDQYVDIVAERYDLAIRTHCGMLPDSALAQRTLARAPVNLFASPAYLAAHGDPQDPADLACHASLFMRRDNASPAWRLEAQEDRSKVREISLAPRLQAGCVNSLKQSAQAGFGIVALPAYVCRAEMADGSLRRVLPQWSAGSASITALMPSRQGMGRAVRAFLDHLVAHLPAAVNGQAIEPGGYENARQAL